MKIIIIRILNYENNKYCYYNYDHNNKNGHNYYWGCSDHNYNDDHDIDNKLDNNFGEEISRILNFNNIIGMIIIIILIYYVYYVHFILFYFIFCFKKIEIVIFVIVITTTI